jgi:hypothetical protein
MRLFASDVSAAHDRLNALASLLSRGGGKIIYIVYAVDPRIS